MKDADSPDGDVSFVGGLVSSLVVVVCGQLRLLAHKVLLVDVMRLPTVLMAMDHEEEDVADNIDMLEE